MIDIENLPSVDLDHVDSIPDIAGVYLFINNGMVIYIGSSSRIKQRILSHIRPTVLSWVRPEFTPLKIAWIKTNPYKNHDLEIKLLRHFKPPLNINSKNKIKSPSNKYVYDYTVMKIAAHCGVDIRTVYRWIKQGSCPWPRIKK